VLFPALSTPIAQTLSSERWLTMMIVGSIPAMRIPSMGLPPTPPDADGVGRSMGECGEGLSVRLSFAIGERVY
jgi:hypothetical protein